MKKKKAQPSYEWSCPYCSETFGLNKSTNKEYHELGGVDVNCPYCEKKVVCGDEDKVGGVNVLTYDGSVGWLIFWIIFFFPIAIILLFLNLSSNRIRK